MHKSEYINGYAIALKDIAMENKNLDKYKEDLNTISSAFELNNEFIEIMDSRNIEINEKIKIINTILLKKIDSNIMNLLYILAEKRKTWIFEKIARKFEKEINRELGIKGGVVYSTIPLDKAYIKKLEVKMRKHIKAKKVELKNKIDNNLISGIAIEVDGGIYEYSVQSKLADIREELLEKRSK